MSNVVSLNVKAVEFDGKPTRQEIASAIATLAASHLMVTEGRPALVVLRHGYRNMFDVVFLMENEPIIVDECKVLPMVDTSLGPNDGRWWIYDPCLHDLDNYYNGVAVRLRDKEAAQ